MISSSTHRRLGAKMRPSLAALTAAVAVAAGVATTVILTIAGLQLPERPPPVEPIRLRTTEVADGLESRRPAPAPMAPVPAPAPGEPDDG